MKNGTYTVYMHIFPNKKTYIGITKTDVRERWGTDGVGYSGQSLMNRAINKYGWENVEHIIIAERLTKKEACQLEIDMIKYWNTTDANDGYNVTSGGEYGYTFNEQSIEANRIRNTGENSWHYGKTDSEETCKRRSDSLKNFWAKNKGRFNGDKNPNYGNKWCDESRKRLSEFRKSWKIPEEQRMKLIEQNAKSKPVLQFDENMNYISKFISHNEVVRKLGISNVYLSTKNHNRKVNGFYWYNEEDLTEGEKDEIRIYNRLTPKSK